MKCDLREKIIELGNKLYMGEIRFREEKYWTYIEFYGELVFDNNEGKRWLEICHYSPSRNMISFSTIQFNLELIELIVLYFNKEKK